MADAGAVYLPERLHAVRIAVKKLRYAVELSTEAAGERGGDGSARAEARPGAARPAARLQMLIDAVRQTQASLTPPSVTVWRDLDALVASLEDDCRRLHARYMRMRDELDAIDRTPQRPVALRTPAARRRGERGNRCQDRTSCISFATASPKSAATRGPTTPSGR